MVGSSRLVTRARAEGLVILLVALGYLHEARGIPALFQSPGVPGPAAFPTLLGVALGLAGLFRLVFGGKDDAAGDADAPDTAPPPAGVRRWLSAHGRFYALWAVILGFLALMPYAGFPLAAAIALTLMFRLLGERRWAVAAGLSVATTAVLFVAFAYGLGVRLPLGVLALLGR